MSVEAMAVVLHHSKAKGTAKLVLLGVANHQGDGGAWPSVATLATYANVTERNVQKALEVLRGMGELEVNVQGGGLLDHDDYTRPNLYQVKVMCPPWCDRTHHHRDTRKRSGRQTRLPVGGPGPSEWRPEPVDKPGVDSDRGYDKSDNRVSDATPGGVSDATPKPSIEPSDNSVSASTTDRARPTPAPPPVDELARVRAKLNADTAATLARDIRRG